MSDPRRLPPLNALRAFEAAARHLSFKAAAAELRVTPTAVSHQIRLLEGILGFALFERRTRAVQLTEAGRALQPTLTHSFDAIANAFEALSRAPQRRGVTLSATPAFTARWLVPRIADWQRKYPGINLRLHASEEPVNLENGDADAAIRYGRGPYCGLKADLLFEDRFAPVVSPRLNVGTLRDLRRQSLIHFDWRRPRRDAPTWRLWAARAGLKLDTDGGLRFSDESHAIQAAIAGQGVALLSLALVAAELEGGALAQPFGPVLDGFQYRFVVAAERAQETEIAALRDWLLGGAATS